MKRDPALNFDFIPYWTIPFRFFLTAPMFAMAAGLSLMLLGVQALAQEDVFLWQSRWLKEVIYTLHLLTLGTISMVMAGALFQVTSVVGGTMLPGGKASAATVHSLLVAGTVLFLVAMLGGGAWLYAAAACSLLSGFTILALSGLVAIQRSHRHSPTLGAMRLSLISLLTTVLIGTLLLVMNGFPEWFGFDRRWTDVHLTWALAGWVGLLIVGVSFQVIPMFHVTPSFALRLQQWLPLMTFGAVILVSVAAFFFSGEILFLIAKAVLLCCYGVYAVAVIRLLEKRKRKIEDITVQFWKTAAICLFLFILTQLLLALNLFEAWGARIWLIGGVFLVYGSVLSVIAGMLQKIVPFLSYLHMQRFCNGDFEAIKSLPHMRAILKINHSRWFFRLHLASLVALLLMIMVPRLTLLAGIIVCMQFGLLLFIVARVALMVRAAEHGSLSRANGS